MKGEKAPEAGTAERPSAGRVLIVDDDRSFAGVIHRELERLGFQAAAVPSGEEALARAAHEDFDVVLLDLRLGGRDGLEVLEALRDRGVGAEVIVLTGHGTIESAIGAMRAGAREYLTKPCKLSELEVHLRKAVEERRTREENYGLKRYLSRTEGESPLITRSPRLERVLEPLARLAESDVPVLIQGESGTGKELVARRLHALGPLREQPFIAINCAVLKTDILESELFGHEKGAFTGAVRRRLGLFEIASGGTLFLDEIGEIEEGIQAKLLRVLQFGELRRVGGNETIRVRARVVAATNKDLEREVAEGRFRQDLFFRLNVVTLLIPPLRERAEDIEPLFRHYLSVYGGGKPRQPTEGAAALLKRHSWPGNVRELENVVRRILIFHDQPVIDEAVIGAVLPRLAEQENPSLLTLEEAERRHILRVLVDQGNDKRRAAEVLGISLKTLYNKLHQYGELPPARAREDENG